MLKIIELFAGIGSQTQALKNIGVEHEVVAISEIDKYAVKSYEAIHGEVNNLGDVCKIETLPQCDLLTYSFPCQDISVAGKGAGIKEGTRSGLLLEVERLIEVSEKPKYLLMENVKNLVGKKNKPEFDRWCEKLESLGYSNYWQVLNAKNYGIPQNRERVFMISILGEHEPYIFPNGFDNGIRLKDMLEHEVDEKYYLSEKMINYVSSSGTGGFFYKPEFNPEIAKPITASVAKMQRAGCANYITEPNECVQAGSLERYGNDQMNRYYDPKGISPTITVVSGGGREQKIIDNYRIRKLTPLECWRLMGFKDEQFNKAQQVNSNSQLYKQAGNSIVVDVLEYIFKNLFQEG